MKYLSLLALVFATLASAKPLKPVDGPSAVSDVSDRRRADTPDPSDWKYAHGWDGTTLPPIGTVVASPNSTADGGGVQTNNIGGVFIDVCINLGSDWDKKISSFGPDNCNACRLWEEHDCRLKIPGSGSPAEVPMWFIEYPGDATGGLGQENPWNDRVSSFMCSPAVCRSG